MAWSLTQSTIDTAEEHPVIPGSGETTSTRPSFHLDFASEADDAALRRILRLTPMPGSIRISLEREPSYFDAAKAEGGRHHTFIARDSSTGDVFAMGCRTVREVYVNGQSQRVGYLSQLRILPGYRHLHRSLLRQGFALLNETRARDEASFDITTIVSSNRRARRILEYGLPYLPRYTAVEQILTFMVPTGIWSNIRRWKRVKFKLPKNRMTTPLQFEPVQSLPSPVWDQRSFKQIVIHRYSAWLQRFRWLLHLPPPGTVLSAIYLTQIPPDLSKLDALIRKASAIGGQYLAISLSAGNPLAHVLQRYYRPHIYDSTLYVVHPPDMPVELDGRCIHVEAALL